MFDFRKKSIDKCLELYTHSILMDSTTKAGSSSNDEYLEYLTGMDDESLFSELMVMQYNRGLHFISSIRCSLDQLDGRLGQIN